MQEIVVDDPFAPLQLEPIPVVPEAREESRRLLIRRRRGIERQPAVRREIGLHPAVRVAGAHDQVAADVVVFAGQKSVDVARWNAHGPKHHGHRCGEIFAMSGALLEQKICQWVGLRRSGQVKRIPVMRSQISLDRVRLFIWRLSACAVICLASAGMRGSSAGNCRYVSVHGLRIIRASVAQRGRRGLGQDRTRLILHS